MKNRIIAVLAGIAAGWIVVYIGELVLHQFVELPKNLDYTNKKNLENYISNLPISVLIGLLIIWAFSAYIGGLVSGKLAKANWKRVCLITGTILLVGNIVNFIAIPHPIWVNTISVIMYLPLSYLGGALPNKNLIKQ